MPSSLVSGGLQGIKQCRQGFQAITLIMRRSPAGILALLGCRDYQGLHIGGASGYQAVERVFHRQAAAWWQCQFGGAGEINLRVGFTEWKILSRLYRIEGFGDGEFAKHGIDNIPGGRGGQAHFQASAATGAEASTTPGMGLPSRRI